MTFLDAVFRGASTGRLNPANSRGTNIFLTQITQIARISADFFLARCGGGFFVKICVNQLIHLRNLRQKFSR
jgi:hypothetical protein